MNKPHDSKSDTNIMANLSDREREVFDSYVKGLLSPEEESNFESDFINRPEILELLELDMIYRTGMSAASDVLPEQVVQFEPPAQAPPYRMSMAAVFTICALAGSLMFNVAQYTNKTDSIVSVDSSERDSVVSSNVQLLELFPVRSASDTFEPVAYLNISGKDFLPVFSVKLSMPRQASFNVRVVSHPDKQEIVGKFPVVPAGSGDLTFSVPGEQFAAGDYYVEVSSENEPPMLIPFRVGVRD